MGGFQIHHYFLGTGEAGPGNSHESANTGSSPIIELWLILEGAARYEGLLLAPVEGFGLWPRLFLPFGQKNNFLAALSSSISQVIGLAACYLLLLTIFCTFSVNFQ